MPKQRQQPTVVYAPVPATQQQPVMAPPAYQGNVAQQPWGTGTSQFVYQAPPVTQYQQTPAATWQQQYVPQYQYAPRPWGSVTEPNSNRNANVSTDAWPQGGYTAPWGMPAAGGGIYGVPAGQAGQAPGRVYYGSPW